MTLVYTCVFWVLFNPFPTRFVLLAMSRLAPSELSTQLASSPGGANASFSRDHGGVPQSTLLGRQVLALRQMLRQTDSTDLSEGASSLLASPSLPSTSGAPQWKVLVFDRVGQDLLAPVLNVKALRDEGVTLHLYIMSERDPVPEVPAIYFCQPTKENLRRITEDLRAGVYGSYYFNFISPIGRSRLEDLASAAVGAGQVQQIRKLYDQYVNFICLEKEMFTLKHQNRWEGNSSGKFDILYAL